MDDKETKRLTPESTGSEETQKNVELEVISPPHDKTQALVITDTILTDTIRNLQDTGVRGQAAIALLQTGAYMIESNLQRITKERDNAVEQAREWERKYSTEDKKNAVLRNQIKNVGRLRTLQNVFVTSGGLICGTSAKYYIDENHSLAVMAFVAGVIFLLCGWFWPAPKPEEI